MVANVEGLASSTRLSGVRVSACSRSFQGRSGGSRYVQNVALHVETWYNNIRTLAVAFLDCHTMVSAAGAPKTARKLWARYQCVFKQGLTLKRIDAIHRGQDRAFKALRSLCLFFDKDGTPKPAGNSLHPAVCSDGWSNHRGQCLGLRN